MRNKGADGMNKVKWRQLWKKKDRGYNFTSFAKIDVDRVSINADYRTLRKPLYLAVRFLIYKLGSIVALNSVYTKCLLKCLI